MLKRKYKKEIKSGATIFQWDKTMFLFLEFGKILEIKIFLWMVINVAPKNKFLKNFVFCLLAYNNHLHSLPTYHDD